MKTFSTILLWLFVLRIGASQEIKVLNEKGFPISQVYIYNDSLNISIETNERGIGAFKSLKVGLELTLQHPSFHTKVITFSDRAPNPLIIVLEEKMLKMDEVIISANKWEQDASEIPNEILNITSKEIEYQQPQTSADLLKSSGQVFVQKSQLGGGSPFLRGFAANRVLLVVDGVRLNNAIYRSGNLQNVINIDPNALESAEVIFGPGSVIYGSDALGGVMDFHTINPKLKKEMQQAFHGKAFTRYSSANHEKTGHIQLGVSGNKLAAWTSFTYSDYDDLRAGGNRNSDYPGFGERRFFVQRVNGEDQLIENNDVEVQRFSGFEQWNSISKLRYKPSENVDLSYGFYFSNTSNIPRYDRLTVGLNNSIDSLENAEWFYGPQRWLMHALKVRINTKNNFFDYAKFTLAYQDYTESRNDRGFGDNRLRIRTEQVDIYSFNADFDKTVGNQEFFYGTEMVFNDVESDGFRRNIETGEISPTSTRFPDGGSDYLALSTYLSYKNKLSEKWILNAGIRYNFVLITAETQDPEAALLNSNNLELENGAINGSLGAVFKPNRNTRLNALFSSGFRSPNIDDVGKVFELDNELIIVPNENLKPEFAYNFELGVEHFFTDNLKVELIGFYTLLRDAITRGPFTIDGSNTQLIDGELRQLRAQINTDEARIFGGSFQLDYEISKTFFLRSSLTITEGEDISNSEPLRHAPPLFGRTEFMYRNRKLTASIFSEYNGNQFRSDIPITEIDDKPNLYAFHISDPSRDGSPAWATLNINSAYDFNDHFTLSFGIENILDQHYRPYSSGISAPGRNFVVSLIADF
ncbi:MAG: TonB-dependent receptor [Bacteroidota bacterium]